MSVCISELEIDQLITMVTVLSGWLCFTDLNLFCVFIYTYTTKPTFTSAKQDNILGLNSLFWDHLGKFNLTAQYPGVQKLMNKVLLIVSIV